MVFGRDISLIPCFRSSFLYGIGSGLGGGFVSFMSTSKPKMSLHVMMATFTSVTLGYWFVCRYQFSKTKFEMNQMKRAMRERAVLEGTDLERKIMEQAKNA